MSAPREILDLVEHYSRNRDLYRSGGCNEAQVRHEFIDPMLGALGWDVQNAQHASPQYREVVHEDSIKVGKAELQTKAPDYSLRLGGMRKIFVEAKRPSVDILKNPEPAFQ